MTTNIAAVADALLASRASGELIPTQPFLAHLNSADDAYAVQDLVAGALGWHEGGVGRHWKSGGAKRDALITHAALPPWYPSLQQGAPERELSRQGSGLGA